MRTVRGSVVQVFVSVPTAAVGRRLAEALVGERLCACAQLLGPMRSIYRWRSQVERAREHLLVLKARRADLRALEARVLALHPYDVPEILALPVVAGHEAYLDWLDASTRRPRGSQGR